MFDIGRLKDGDKVVISGAAGSVGLVSLPSLLNFERQHHSRDQRMKPSTTAYRARTVLY